jgi:hypothetical protein
MTGQWNSARWVTLAIGAGLLFLSASLCVSLTLLIEPRPPDILLCCVAGLPALVGSSLVFRSLTGLSPTSRETVRCPLCGQTTMVSEAKGFDQKVTCDKCGGVFIW